MLGASPAGIGSTVASSSGNFICPDIAGIINAGHIFGVDNTDPLNMSKALVTGRKLAADLNTALGKYMPKVFRNSYLVSIAGLVGARETRRVLGDYCLMADDYLERRSFDDEICRNSYEIDIHVNENQINDVISFEEYLKFEEGNKTLRSTYTRYKIGESNGIPYRCLTPKGPENVLMAGRRSISCDRHAQGNIRVIPFYLSTGEVAVL